MISSLKSQDLYEVSIGLGKESYDNENDWLNDGDAAFGAIGLSLSPIACATSLNLLNSQRICGQNWKETLESIVRIIIALWRAHVIKNSQPMRTLLVPLQCK